MTKIDNKTTLLVFTIEDVTKEVMLPNTAQNIAWELVLTKFDAETIADMVQNDSYRGEQTERLIEYREWYGKCQDAVKDLDMTALNKAAQEQLELERIEAERIEAEKRAEEEEARREEEERVRPMREFEAAKAAKLAAIAEYDKSDAVNGFSINGIDGWLDRDTRTSLVNTVSVELANGKEVTTLWFGLVKLTLNCENVLYMLAQLEMYAHECYNVTQQHIANITAVEPEGENPDYVELKEQIESYDYTYGYPKKPAF